MKIAGFTAEASLYRTAGRYYTRMDHFGDGGSISLALENCPPKCIADCKLHCRQDGLSASRCATLCASDCSAYSSLPLFCGPCVNDRQVCVLCGGVAVNQSCCPTGFCGDGCCPEGSHCCDNSGDCCPDGYLCIDAGPFGRWCLWNPLDRSASREQGPAPPPHPSLRATRVAAAPAGGFAVS